MNASGKIANSRARHGRRSWGRVGAALVGALALLGASACRSERSPGGDSSTEARAVADAHATVTMPPALDVTATSCPLGTALVAADETTGEMLWEHCAGSLGGVEVLAADATTVLAAEYGPDTTGGVTVLAFDAATGDQRWSHAVAPFNESYERDAFYASGNQLGSGVVVFSVVDSDQAGGGASVVGIDAASGQERWRVPAEGTFVTAHGEEVAIAATPGAMFETPSGAERPPLRVVAFERSSGKVRWREDEAIGDLSAPWGPRIGSDVMVFTQIEPAAEDTAPADRRWETVAVDANAGTRLWGRQQGPAYLAMVAVDISIGLVPVGSTDAELEAFDTRTGERRWSTPVTLQVPWPLADPTSPVVAVGRSADGAPSGVAVFERSSGDLRWVVDGPVEPAGVTGELVLVSRPGEIAALDAGSGALRWQRPFAHPYGTELRAGDGRLYLSSSRGMFDPGSGEGDQAELILSGGTDLGSFALPNGDAVRFVEMGAAGSSQYLCALPDGSNAAQHCIAQRDLPLLGGATSVVPAQTGVVQFASGPRPLYVVPLPTGHPRPVSVRDAEGNVWPSAEAGGRDQLVVLDPQLGGSPGMSTRVPLEVRAADGTLVANVASRATAAPPGPAPPQPPVLPGG